MVWVSVYAALAGGDAAVLARGPAVALVDELAHTNVPGSRNAKRYEDVQAGWRDGKYQIADRNLMIDGLMKQFIIQVDEA